VKRILVVGAGPAGCSGAYSASRLGAEVLLVDIKKNIGEPVRSAELVPKLLKRTVDFKPIQTISNLVTVLNGKEYVVSSPAYMVDRREFDRHLVSLAIRAGAKVSMDTKLSFNGNETLINGIKSEFDFIIGCDGPSSFVGRHIGIKNMDFMFGIQGEYVLEKRLEDAYIFLDKKYVYGYAWLFPKGEYANVGLGISLKYSRESKRLLEGFVKMLVERKYIVNDSFITHTSGLIPCGGILTPCKNNILLAGDACGLAHPITGAGIAYACESGILAGKNASEGSAEKYKLEIMERYHETFERGRRKRKFLKENWNNFDETIRKCWPCFEEYNK